MKQTNNALRIIKKAVLSAKADAKTIFPLLCPVKEAEWIDGWKEICRLVYSDSAIAEEGCVFKTNIPLEGKAVWICSKYDAEKHNIEYIKHVIGKAIIKWGMSVKDISENSSEIYFDYTATSLSETGKDYVKHLDKEGFNGMVEHLKEKMNYYVTHSKMKKNIIENSACRIKAHFSKT